MAGSHLGITVKIWIDGMIARIDTVPFADDVKFLGEEHVQFVADQEAAGRSWMVEIDIGDGKPVRFGTDTGGMVDPIGPMPIGELPAAARRLWT